MEGLSMIANRVTATKEVTWDMAHMLASHEGLCSNLHGHTYRMEVTVMRTGDSELGIKWATQEMVTDFSELKKILHDKIVDKLDHCVMLWSGSNDPFEQTLLSLVPQFNKKNCIVDYRPTAEAMAKHFYRVINSEYERRCSDVRVVRLRLWETPTSYAEITGGIANV